MTIWLAPINTALAIGLPKLNEAEETVSGSCVFGIVLSFRRNAAILYTVRQFSRLVRQVKQEMETVIKVLQPGPLGIVEHKFSAEEIREAKMLPLREQ
ncbi:uncharacterized protein LOC130761286 [Actinidia eriantha]|uniref:uncharacterized protein LOC130761286 n=1 Tax=Actinidia eriantha TaxID=165200 RepID=UPI002583DD8F|nr:uncharacterized protein LOC130761286 [Actinidia eriantha]